MKGECWRTAFLRPRPALFRKIFVFVLWAMTGPPQDLTSQRLALEVPRFEVRADGLAPRRVKCLTGFMKPALVRFEALAARDVGVDVGRL